MAAPLTIDGLTLPPLETLPEASVPKDQCSGDDPKILNAKRLVVKMVKETIEQPDGKKKRVDVLKTKAIPFKQETPKGWRDAETGEVSKILAYSFGEDGWGDNAKAYRACLGDVYHLKDRFDRPKKNKEPRQGIYLYRRNLDSVIVEDGLTAQGQPGLKICAPKAHDSQFIGVRQATAVKTSDGQRKIVISSDIKPLTDELKPSRAEFSYAVSELEENEEHACRTIEGGYYLFDGSLHHPDLYPGVYPNKCGKLKKGSNYERIGGANFVEIDLEGIDEKDHVRVAMSLIEILGLDTDNFCYTDPEEKLKIDKSKIAKIQDTIAKLKGYETYDQLAKKVGKFKSYDEFVTNALKAKQGPKDYFGSAIPEKYRPIVIKALAGTLRTIIITPDGKQNTASEDNAELTKSSTNDTMLLFIGLGVFGAVTGIITQKLMQRRSERVMREMNEENKEFQRELAGKNDKQTILEKVGENMSEKARNGEYDTMTMDPTTKKYFDKTSKQLLKKRGYNSFSIEAPPGWGKEGLMQLLAREHPNITFISTDGNAMRGGTRYHGDIEERITDIPAEVEKIRANGGFVVLFIDEAHASLLDIGARDENGRRTKNPIAEWKKMLAKGRRSGGLTLGLFSTPDEWKDVTDLEEKGDKKFSNHRDHKRGKEIRALLKRFQHFKADPKTLKDMEVVVKAAISHMEAEDGIKIHVPDAAIDLLCRSALSERAEEGYILRNVLDGGLFLLVESATPENGEIHIDEDKVEEFLREDYPDRLERATGEPPPPGAAGASATQPVPTAGAKAGATSYSAKKFAKIASVLGIGDYGMGVEYTMQLANFVVEEAKIKTGDNEEQVRDKIVAAYKKWTEHWKAAEKKANKIAPAHRAKRAKEGTLLTDEDMDQYKQMLIRRFTRRIAAEKAKAGRPLSDAEAKEAMKPPSKPRIRPAAAKPGSRGTPAPGSASSTPRKKKPALPPVPPRRAVPASPKKPAPAARAADPVTLRNEKFRKLDRIIRARSDGNPTFKHLHAEDMRTAIRQQILLGNKKPVERLVRGYDARLATQKSELKRAGPNIRRAKRERDREKSKEDFKKKEKRKSLKESR